MGDMERLGKAVALLARAFNREVDDLLLESYRIGLDGIPVEQVEQAVTAALQTAKFMPSPAELAGRVSLRRPGLFKCGGCGVDFSFPESSRRGYCGPCWKSIGGEEEDARLKALEGGDTPKEITG